MRRENANPFGKEAAEPMRTDLGGRIRRLRQEKGLTIAQLAALVETSRSMISQVEQGKALPSLPTLERITDVLGVSLGEFFQTETEPRPREEDIIVRRDARRSIPIPETDSSYLLLSPRLRSKLEFFISEFAPGAAREIPVRLRHSGEEYFFVLEGAPELILGSERYALSRGDSGCFDSSRLHNWSNPGAERAKVLFAVLPEDTK